MWRFFKHFYVPEYSRDVIYEAYIETNKPVNFTLIFANTYSRTVYSKITGTITYLVPATVYGSVPYDSDYEAYLLTLDTSLLSAQAYTVGLTYSGDYYESSRRNLYIDVLERVTLLNGNRDLVIQLVRTIYIGDEYNFTFSYVDRDLNANITNLLNLLLLFWYHYH